MIEKYTTKLSDRITRRISNRIIDTDGSLKTTKVMMSTKKNVQGYSPKWALKTKSRT